MTFIDTLCVNKWQIKIEELQWGHYIIWKSYIQDASRKKQYHYFFHWTPKISRKIDFGTCTLD